MAARDARATPHDENAGFHRGDPFIVRGMLIDAIAAAMAARGLSQVQAARLLQTDQPTFRRCFGVAPKASVWTSSSLGC